MKLSIYEMSDRFLQALKIGGNNVDNAMIAMKVIEKYGDLEKALAEATKDKYNRLRFTPELLIRAMVEPEEDASDFAAKELATKYYSLHNLVYNDSIRKGEGFEQLMKTVDVIKTLQLSLREAWATKFIGGKKFILGINVLRDGDVVIERIKSALAEADRYLEDESKKGGAIAHNVQKMISRY